MNYICDFKKVLKRVQKELFYHWRKQKLFISFFNQNVYVKKKEKNYIQHLYHLKILDSLDVMLIYSQWKSFTGPFYSRSNDGRYSTAVVMGDMSHFGEVWPHWPLLAVTSYNSLGLFLYLTTKEEPSQASRLCPDPFQGIIFPPSTRNLARSHKEWGECKGEGLKLPLCAVK